MGLPQQVRGSQQQFNDDFDVLKVEGDTLARPPSIAASPIFVSKSGALQNSRVRVRRSSLTG